MSEAKADRRLHHSDTAPGDQRVEEEDYREAFRAYLIGLGLSILLTVVSFVVTSTTLVWGPSIPVALAVLAIGQMGVHIVFFLQITSGPDNLNNVMALAFGIFIVFLLIAGSLWIMTHLDHTMLPMSQIMQMQR